MKTYTLAGTVTDHDGLTYSVGETVTKAERHERNVAYYTDRDNFRGCYLLSHVFDENDEVVHHQLYEQNDE